MKLFRKLIQNYVKRKTLFATHSWVCRSRWIYRYQFIERRATSIFYTKAIFFLLQRLKIDTGKKKRSGKKWWCIAVVVRVCVFFFSLSMQKKKTKKMKNKTKMRISGLVVMLRNFFFFNISSVTRCWIVSYRY